MSLDHPGDIKLRENVLGEGNEVMRREILGKVQLERK